MNLLIGLAISIAFFHTLTGPDHYLPFVAMSKARNWSTRKTLQIAWLAGLGHILSSVLLGILGMGLGLAVQHLEIIESTRGEWAAWILITFGLTYTVYGLCKTFRKKPHTHDHAHLQGLHHSHTHQKEQMHLHAEKEKKEILPWILCVIFIFGPCEPLIPLLMYPAAKGSILEIGLVTAAFSITTLLTMSGLIFFSLVGIQWIPLSFQCLKKYNHALAGLTIGLSGCAIKFGGL